MGYREAALRLDVQTPSPSFCYLTVTVPRQLVKALYNAASHAQQSKISAHGFSSGTIPLSYIENNYRASLNEHAKEFLFNYFVISFLLNQIRDKKLVLIGDPRLVDIKINPDQDAIYSFEATTYEPPKLQSWKHFPFKAPRRKNYRDIDRQVDSFIKHELEQRAKTDGTIQIGDWVNFDIWLADNKNRPALANFQESLWLKVGDEVADIPFQELFVDRQTGDSFCTNNRCLQNYFSDQMNHNYTYCLTIKDVVPATYFCLPSLKKHFRIKTNKDMHKKLIEVFSFRNDISQRRLMAEGALKLLIKHHPIFVQEPALLRQQQVVLDMLQSNPDYPVYKAQSNFKDYLAKLAHKQVQEMVIADTVAYNENLSVSLEDVHTYLNLTNRPRTKEFVYFEPPETKINGQETPIPDRMLQYCCLREKALNHVIYHLTRN